MADGDTKTADELKAEADAKAKAEADAKVAAEAEAKAKAEAEAKAAAEGGPKTLEDALALIADLKTKADAAGNVPEWAQKRIDSLTAKFREEERKAAALAVQLEQAKAGKTAVQPSDEEINARAAAIAAQQAFDSACLKVLSDGRKAIPGFDEAVQRLHTISPAMVKAPNGQSVPNMPQPFVEAVLELEQAPRVLAELAKPENNDEAARIMAMPPAKQGVALARFASKLAPPKEVSKTEPPPGTTVSGRTRGVPSLEDDGMSMAEWVALRNKQIAERRKGAA